ncbi:hypothetical protein ACFLYD_08020 [Chloroflexota bacterium]
MPYQESCADADPLDAYAQETRKQAEAERFRRQGRDLLRQVGGDLWGALSPQGRRLLYRLALWQMVQGSLMELSVGVSGLSPAGHADRFLPRV